MLRRGNGRVCHLHLYEVSEFFLFFVITCCLNENLISVMRKFICSFLNDYVQKHKMANLIAFVDPSTIGALGCGNVGQRSRALALRFKDARKGQYFLMPYNDV